MSDGCLGGGTRSRSPQYVDNCVFSTQGACGVPHMNNQRFPVLWKGGGLTLRHEPVTSDEDFESGVRIAGGLLRKGELPINQKSCL